VKAAAKIPRLMNLRQIEQATGISRFTIARLVSRGELPALRETATGIRRVLVDAADVAALIERWKRESAGDGCR
jgi:excisionase family DNA binding protein